MVGLLIAIVVLLVAIAALLGWAVGDQTASKTKTVTAFAQTTMAAPAGHMGGPNLAIAQIGDPARGARLWQSKRCSDCHSYAGRGGKDVFLSAGCGACHTLAAAGTKATVGPNLDTALKGRSSAFVRKSIFTPNASIAVGYRAGVMPTTYRSQLTSRQVADLVAFLLKQRK